MKPNQPYGKWGKETAAKHFIHKGHAFLGQNDCTANGKIAIITKHSEAVIFIEVKTRTSNTMRLREEIITPNKGEQMTAYTERYTTQPEIAYWQIDVISIERTANTTPKITYFENAS